MNKERMKVHVPKLKIDGVSSGEEKNLKARKT